MYIIVIATIQHTLTDLPLLSLMLALSLTWWISSPYQWHAVIISISLWNVISLLLLQTVINSVYSFNVLEFFIPLHYAINHSVMI